MTNLNYNQTIIAGLVADHISGVQVEGALIDELRGVLPATYTAIHLVEHDGKARSAIINVDQTDGTQLQVRCFADGSVGTEILPTVKVPFVLSPFDVEECGRHGSGRVTVRAHGYWSSDIGTLYVERKMSWTDHSHEWVCTMSHSSGGRDTDAVKSDLQAERNFSVALTALAAIGDDLLTPATVLTMEALHQQEMDAYKAKDAAEKAEKQALIEADPMVGDARAKAMVNLAIAAVRAAATDQYGMNRSVIVIKAPQRGTECVAAIKVYANRGGAARVEVNGTTKSAREAMAFLSGQSHRSELFVITNGDGSLTAAGQAEQDRVVV